MESKFPRRNFIKKSTLVSTSIVGASVLSSCGEKPMPRNVGESLPRFHGNGYQPADGVFGIIIFADWLRKWLAGSPPYQVSASVNDGPFSLADEDWIPHSAAWLTGLKRL